MVEHPADPSGAAANPVPWPWREPMQLRLYYSLSRVLFWFVYRVLGLRRSVIVDNLRRSFPELDDNALQALRRDFIERQSEIFAEIIFGSRIDADELRQRVRIIRPALLAGAASPRPLILAAGHQCNFEWMLLRISIDLGPRLLALYKPLSNAWFEARFRHLRTRFGANLVPAKSIVRELARFREASAIGIIADQVPRTSPEKLWMQFLHQDTPFFMGPEMLGRALRSQVAYVSMRRVRRGCYEIELQPLHAPGEKLMSGEITERYVRALERDIRHDPAGWWWSHRRWKLQRPA